MTLLVITAPFLDDDLLNHHEPFLQTALPGRGQQPTGLEAAITQMVPIFGSSLQLHPRNKNLVLSRNT
jgi:hypothetical protein